MNDEFEDDKTFYRSIHFDVTDTIAECINV